jgi:hypothetical protein
MTVYLIIDTDENRYVANSTGLLDFAHNEYKIEVDDINEIDTVITKLNENDVEILELDFDTEPLIPV